MGRREEGEERHVSDATERKREREREERLWLVFLGRGRRRKTNAGICPVLNFDLVRSAGAV